jgi:pimeloyl-ACP methyl ester carboxylesterase
MVNARDETPGVGTYTGPMTITRRSCTGAHPTSHPTGRRGNRRRRGLPTLAVIAGAGVLLGAGGDAVAGPRPTTVTATVPAPGPTMHTVWNQGHRLAFYVTSGHQPAIVLDAGGGEDHTQWSRVAPALARQTGDEIVTYDRSGLGNSPEVLGPWTAQNAASDLQAGLAQLGVKRGAILVSHSLAGEIAFRLVQRAPGLVAGAVLVDASLPEFYTAAETARIVAANAPLIAKLRTEPSTASGRQLIALSYHYGPVHDAYHKLIWPRNLPATEIVSTQTPYSAAIDIRAWHTAARTFVAGAPNRRLVVVDSSHEIPQDRPGIVVAQIEAMLDGSTG